MKILKSLLVLLLMAAAPALLVGCDDGGGNGDASTDTMTDTTLDTSLDTTPDTTPDTTLDTAADVPPDTAIDTAPDSTGCVSPTAAAGGTCSVVELCGCEGTEVCMLQGVSADCQLYETCMAVTPGTVAVGAECTYATDCIPGSICVRYSGEEMGHCYQWCRDSSDCIQPGAECNVSLTLTPSAGDCADTPINTPINACSLPCPEDADCDPFGGTGATAGCDDGEGCWIRSDCGISWCFPNGTVESGGDCAVDSCVAGNICLEVVEGSEYLCAPFCDDDHPCAAGTCYPLTPPYSPNPDLGYCYEA